MKMKLRARKHLEGWDFKDLATQRDPFYPRVATLNTFGKDWVDFTREIHAITLFGRGFGDIFQPADSGKLCNAWAKLPTKKYYIVACVSDLKEIMETDGDPDANPMKISDGLVWHTLDRIFEPCQCIGGKARHSELAQVLFPSRLSYVLPKRNPIQLENHGAVIFGHNALSKWFWKDIGDPEKGDPPSPPEESEISFHDSAIGASVGSSTAESSGRLAGSTSSQQSSTRIPRKPVPGPPPLRYEDEPHIALTGKHDTRNSFDTPQTHREKHPKPLMSHIFNKLVRHRSNAGE